MMDTKSFVAIIAAIIAAAVAFWYLVLRRQTAVAQALITQQISLSNQNPSGNITVNVSAPPGSSVPVTITVSLSNGQPNSSYTVTDRQTGQSYSLTTGSGQSGSLTISYSLTIPGFSPTSITDTISISGPGISNSFTATINYALSPSYIANPVINIVVSVSGSSPTTTFPISTSSSPPTTSPILTSPSGGTLPIPSGAQYAVDYNYANVFACQGYSCGNGGYGYCDTNVASQVQSALRQFSSQIVGYVVWDGCYSGHVTVFFSSQPSSTLVQQIGNALNNALSIPYYNVDYNGSASGASNIGNLQKIYASYP